jgi:putative transposase
MSFLAFKYKLKPTQSQIKTLTQWCGSCRYIWNNLLAQNKEKYILEKKFLFRMEMQSQLPKLKQELTWLNDVPSQALQCRVQDLELAIKRCYKSGFGFPKFKKKGQDSSIRLPQIPNHEHIKKKEIKIPKLGWVKWIKHRPLQGKLKSITIKQEADNWYCVCLCEDNTEIKQKELDYNDLIGIDLGLCDFLVASDGLVIDTPKYYRKKQKKLKRCQRRFAKKTGTKNREKAKKKLRKLHLKIRNQRQDFTHKASSMITKCYSFVGVEDLNIAGMKKNHKLAKSISDQGWAMFLSQLEYKSKRNGGCTVKIDRWAPSTKTCSSCGKKHQLTLKDRQMKCECGLDISRDLNAAINIRNWSWDLLTNTAGTAGIHACGDTSNGLSGYQDSSCVSMRQENIRVIDSDAHTL